MLGGFQLPEDDFSVSHGAELRGVVTESGGMHVHRRFFAAGNFFLGQIVNLPKAAIVAANAEQPLAIRTDEERDGCRDFFGADVAAEGGAITIWRSRG